MAKNAKVYLSEYTTENIIAHKNIYKGIKFLAEYGKFDDSEWISRVVWSESMKR